MMTELPICQHLDIGECYLNDRPPHSNLLVPLPLSKVFTQLEIIVLDRIYWPDSLLIWIIKCVPQSLKELTLVNEPYAISEQLKQFTIVNVKDVSVVFISELVGSGDDFYTIWDILLKPFS